MFEYGRYELGINAAFLENLPSPQSGLGLSRQRLENRLRRAYRSGWAVALRQRTQRLLGPARTDRIRKALKTGRRTELGPQSQPPGTTHSPGGRLEPRNQSHRLPTGRNRDGEAARSLARALHTADIPHSLHSLDLNVAAPNRDPRYANEVSDFPYDLNLFVVNADQIPEVASLLGAEVFARRFNIGFWLWELSSFPSTYEAAFDLLHEVWTPSAFCVDSFSKVSPHPVRRLPLPVVPPEARWGREHFGLANEPFTFLFMFNFLSYFERKNPMAVIEAFRRAFFQESKSDRPVQLVFKTSQSDFAPELYAEMCAAMSDLPIKILDGYYEADEVSSLVSCCDAYVSLHRSEGYGLTIAEAMYHEKPVIATAYSGNVDFFGINNGYPVRYELVQLTEDAGPYAAGAQWANPDIDHAAELMRRAVTETEEAKRLASRGQQEVRTLLSEQAVGEKLREHFEATLRRLHRLE